MNITRSLWLTIVALVALSIGTAANARVYTGSKDLSTAWQQYLTDGADAVPTTKYPYGTCFRRSAIVNSVPETLLLAVARGESDFNPDARSHANAHGLMQILWPSTARHLGLNLLSELYDPCKNIDAGARYLKELLNHYDGNVHLALAAYNYGPRRIVSVAEMPDGAEWYSGYIYRHLQHVLGGRRTKQSAGTDYLSEGKLDLISFSEPYRAEAFVAALERDPGDLRIDWFRSGQAEFKVVLLYDNEEDLQKSRAQLSRAGFTVP